MALDVKNLIINESLTISGDTRLGNIDVGVGAFKNRINANGDASLVINSNGGVLSLNADNSNNLILVNGGGAVGVGTDTITAGTELDVNGRLDVRGNIRLTGTATTTDQARTIEFTGFDKEGTTDFSDAAFIKHTTNTGGHTGSVLEISSQNDASDGIAFTTNASSQLKHNSNTIWDAGNDGSGSGLDADLLDGNHATAFAAASHTHTIGYYNSAISSNLDTLYSTGQFGFANTTTGRPEDYGQGINIVNSGTAHNGTDNWITQLAFGTAGSTSYFRTKVNTGAWTAWRKIWNEANDGASSGLDADLLDGQHGSYYLDTSGTAQTKSGNLTVSGTLNVTNNLSANRYFQNSTGVPTSNLGSPTITEMALFDEQFDNKTAFYPIANLKFYTSTDNVTFTEYTTPTDTQKRIFLGGDGNAGITIPNLTPYFRIEVTNAGPYVFLNALYMYWSSQSHSTAVRIRARRRSDLVFVQWTNSSSTVGAWPGHLYLPFSTIPFLTGGTSSGHYDIIHIDFQPTWASGAYSTFPIILDKFQIWGGYPAGRRNIYTTDENKNVAFPAALTGTRLISNIATGTSPLLVTSTTAVTNLNADMVDGYHSSSLWRSDGGTWNPSANIALNQSGNGQEWSFDIVRNGFTGGYWQVWDSAHGTMLAVNAETNRVGVGTASPGEKLHVVGKALLNNGGNFYIDSTASNVSLATDGARGIILNTNSTNRLSVTATGNVGIGTTLPSESLHVIGKTYLSGGSAAWNETSPGTARGTLHLGEASATSNFGTAITFGARDAADGATAQAGIYTRTDGTYGTNMYFATTDSYGTGSKTRMFINADGKVGIGYTSPSYKLHVNGEGSFNGAIYGTSFVDNNNSSYSLDPSNTGTSLKVAGNVGIGTTSPGEKLEVNGKLKFSANPSWGKYLIIGGDANNGDANTGSIGVTNGNLHLDAATSFGTYLNFYKGTTGVIFGNGDGTIVAWMGPDGDLWKGSADNSGSQYWHAGNDGTGSGLDADLLDGLNSTDFLRVYRGTTNSVVVNVIADILVNHSQSIVINSQSGQYTQVTIKVQSDDNENFDIYVKYNSGSAGLVIQTEIVSLTNDTVTLNPSATAYTGFSREHTTVSGTLNTQDLKVQGNTVWHAGNDGTGSTLDADLLDGNHASAFALSSHSHGQISSLGAITAAVVTPGDTDTIVITDSSDSGFIKRGITIGTGTTTYLRNDGTWGTPAGVTNLTWTAGTTAGPTINSSTGTGAAIPSASGSASGVVTTGSQTFAGVKTITNSTTGSSNTSLTINSTVNAGALPSAPLTAEGLEINATATSQDFHAAIGLVVKAVGGLTNEPIYAYGLDGVVIAPSDSSIGKYLRIKGVSGTTAQTTLQTNSSTSSSITVTLPSTTGTLALTSEIPTVNNGTLTLATSGIATGSASFTANQSGNSTFTVNVPATNLTWTAGTTAGPTVNSSTGTGAAIPLAGTGASGVLSNAAQTIGGEKTFANGIVTGSGTQTWQIESGTNLLFRSGSTPTTRMTISDAGTVTATTFSGSGASLTSLPAGQLTGTVASARLGEGLLGELETSFNIGRIWSRPFNSHTWTLRRNVTTPTAVTSNTATFTTFALGYTPTTGASGDILKIELSLGSTTAQQEKVFVEVTCATNQSTTGMALLSADGYLGVSSGILQVYRYFAQYNISTSNLQVRYPTRVRIA